MQNRPMASSSHLVKILSYRTIEEIIPLRQERIRMDIRIIIANDNLPNNRSYFSLLYKSLNKYAYRSKLKRFT